MVRNLDQEAIESQEVNLVLSHFRITGINATCLTCGLTSNLLLFVNLSSPFSYYAVQIFATVGGIISCIAFVILISVFAQERKYISPSDQFEFTQAFYYSVMAAALYFIVSVFLGINFLATRWHFFPKTFKLYETERKLLLQDTTLMFYLLLGALIFSLIEKWQFLDAVFWADFTLLTIGLGGEFTPKTSLGRVLLLPYVIGGIMILGMLISSLHDLLETAKKRLCNQMAESKRRLIQASFLGSHQEAGELSGGITSPAFICNEDFNALRKLKNNAARKTRWIALVVSALLILAFWLAGAAVFAAAEKSAQWTYPIALYFTYVSLLTLGYGDYIPSTNLGKSFYVLWTVIGVPVLTIFISNMADTMVQVLQNLLLVVGSFTILPNIEILNRIKKWCCSERRAFKGWNQVQKSSMSLHIFLETFSLTNLGEITRSCQTKRGKEKAKLVPDCNRDRSPKILKDALFQVIMDCMVDPNKEYTYEQWLQFADLIFPGSCHYLQSKIQHYH